MDNEQVQFLSVTALSLANILVLIYQTVKRVPREVAKMEAERTESYSEAAESNMQGAMISNEILTQRIKELIKDKRDAWNYIAILKRDLVNHELAVPPYMPTESDPRIKAVK